MIYISTGGKKTLTASQAIKELIPFGISNFELSGGLFSEDLLSELLLLKDYGLNLQLHNYFPPPERPMVLNLASMNPMLLEDSIVQVKKSLLWSKKLGCKYFAVHSGFLFDPKVSTLGNRMSQCRLADRSASIDKFIQNVKFLSNYANDLGVELLVENNVLSKANMQSFSENPFLMVDPIETEAIMSELWPNVGLLLDVAHLKVSAQSLDFDVVGYIDACNQYIKAYHLSDNNGFEDSNNLIQPGAWFFPFLKNDAKFYTIEVYGCSGKECSDQVRIVTDSLGRGNAHRS